MISLFFQLKNNYLKFHQISIVAEWLPGKVGGTHSVQDQSESWDVELLVWKRAPSQANWDKLFTSVLGTNFG